MSVIALNRVGHKSPFSNNKIYVQCTKCGEKFYRELRNIGNKHDCPTHIDGHKLCSVCQQYIHLLGFGKRQSADALGIPYGYHSYDGLNSYCLGCGEVLYHRLSKAYQYLSGIYQLEFSISDLMEQYEIQGGRCFYTKEFMNHYMIHRLADTTSGHHTSFNKDNIVIVACGATSKLPRIEVVKLDPDGIIPSRKRATDAGYDISSSEHIIIPPHSMKSVSTGIAVCPPDGLYFTIEGRSSLFIKSIVPARGIIDATYQGHLVVVLINNSDIPYEVNKGDRIAQIILHNTISADFVNVDSFTPVFDGRGEAGFASSGK